MIVQPFGFLAGAAGGALPDIYTTNLDQWFAPEAATTVDEWVVDQSGNGRDGTVGGTEWVWNGDNYPEITSGTSTSNVITCNYKPDMSGNFTIQVWVNVITTSGTVGDADCGIVHNLTGGNSTDSFSFRARRTTNLATFVRNSGGSVIFNTNYTGFWSSWQLATYTYNTSTGSVLYWGTTQKATSANTGMSSGRDTTMYLAGIFDNNTSNYFTAVKYGSYKVYSETLGLTEITQNYNAEKAHYGL